jgi:hypothetical protein
MRLDILTEGGADGRYLMECPLATTPGRMEAWHSDMEVACGEVHGECMIHSTILSMVGLAGHTVHIASMDTITLVTMADMVIRETSL